MHTNYTNMKFVKRDLVIIILLSIISFIVWQNSFSTFFAQDDFILINHFSQNNLLQDIRNVLGLAQVTHWRPIHNLYFLIAGNIFGKNYIGYHFLTLILQIGASYFVYKIVKHLTGSARSALISGFLYGAHPAHFVSLFWISGGATLIGFFFLILAIYYYLIDRKGSSLISFILALLSSEAMVVGIILFYYINILKPERIYISRTFLILITSISVLFGLIRFLLLTPKTIFDSYQLELSTKVFGAIKYYLLRIAGFAEVSGDQILTLILLGWLVFVSIFIFKNLFEKQERNILLLSVLTIILGLFPFIFIPSHLSPHYMNVSIFGFSIMIGSTLKQLKPIVSIAFLIIFLMIAVYNVNLTMNNNWLVKRSNLAKVYLEKMEREKPTPGSILIFDDNDLSTSEEAYITLGTGEAVKFWFKNKNYKYCFTAFEKCSALP